MSRAVLNPPAENNRDNSTDKSIENAQILENYLDDLLKGVSHKQNRQEIPEFGRKKHKRPANSKIRVDEEQVSEQTYEQATEQANDQVDAREACEQVETSQVELQPVVEQIAEAQLQEAHFEQPCLEEPQLEESQLKEELQVEKLEEQQLEVAAKESTTEQHNVEVAIEPSIIETSTDSKAQVSEPMISRQVVSESDSAGAYTPPAINSPDRQVATNKSDFSRSRDFKPAEKPSVTANMMQQLEAKLAAIEEQNSVQEAPEAATEISETVETPEAEPEQQQAIQSLQEIESLEFAMDPQTWPAQGVECMLCDVAGLKLALPLPQLGVVYELKEDDEVKQLFGQQSWYLGLIKTETDKMQIIDSASFIMPERNISLREQGYKYLVRLAGTPWALACQGIDETVTLNVNDIKWRANRGNRPWLAGTIIEKMCALLDVEGLLELVDESTK